MKDVSATPYAQRLLELHLPRYGEIPRIDLYMDQLVGFLEETLAPLYQPDEKIITRSMVNNYVKQGVLAAATGKKYTRAHVAYLVVICTLKQTFSLSEIDLLIRRQIATFDTGVAYDYDKLEGLPSSYLPDVDETLTTGQGICFDYAALMAAMLPSPTALGTCRGFPVQSPAANTPGMLVRMPRSTGM